MKKHLLLLTFVAFGLFYKSNAMMNTMDACKLLGVHPFASESVIERARNAQSNKLKVEAADFDAKLQELVDACAHLKGIAQFRKKADNRTVKTLSSKRTGIFTKRVTMSELLETHTLNGNLLHSHDHNVVIDVYDYKRIFGTLGIVGTTAAGLAYWFRNDVSSFFNSNMAPWFLFATSKIPFLAKKN